MEHERPPAPADSLAAGHEVRDLPPRWVLGVAIGMAVGAVLMHLGLMGLLWGFMRVAGVPGPAAGKPPIWVDETTRKERYLARRSQELGSYGWVDRSQGVVRVPIARAMAMVVQRGIRWNLASPLPATRQQMPPAAARAASSAATTTREPLVPPAVTSPGPGVAGEPVVPSPVTTANSEGTP